MRDLIKDGAIGKPLFARTRRYGLQLTAAGEAFLPHAERLVSAAHEGAAAVASTDRDANTDYQSHR